MRIEQNEFIIISGRPGFPTHAIIYDIESSTAHESLLTDVLHSIPSLKTYKGQILTGQQSVITTTLQKVLPNLFHVRDWEHTIVNTRLWMRSVGATVSTINTFTDHLQVLLDLPRRQQFDEKFVRFCDSWTTEFHKFYEDKLKTTVEENQGRMILLVIHFLPGMIVVVIIIIMRINLTIWQGQHE